MNEDYQGALFILMQESGGSLRLLKALTTHPSSASNRDGRSDKDGGLSQLIPKRICANTCQILADEEEEWSEPFGLAACISVPTRARWGEQGGRPPFSHYSWWESGSLRNGSPLSRWGSSVCTQTPHLFRNPHSSRLSGRTGLFEWSREGGSLTKDQEPTTQLGLAHPVPCLFSTWEKAGETTEHLHSCLWLPVTSSNLFPSAFAVGKIIFSMWWVFNIPFPTSLILYSKILH